MFIMKVHNECCIFYGLETLFRPLHCTTPGGIVLLVVSVNRSLGFRTVAVA